MSIPLYKLDVVDISDPRLYRLFQIPFNERSERGHQMYKIRDRKFIGLKIKDGRKDSGLTQEELAEAIGITYQQLQRYENGKSNLNTGRLQAIANVLDVPITYFFEETTGVKIKIMEREHTYLSSKEKEFVENLRKIDKTDCQKCIFFLLKHTAEKEGKS